MKKRNRIIVLVDLSDYSEKLIDFSFHLAEKINARVVFVHQIPRVAPALASKKVRDEIYRNETNEATQRLRELAKGRIHSNESFIVGPKPVLSMLTEIQSSYFTDWVVGGLKESNLVKRMILGSTLITIINDSDLLTVALPVSDSVSIPKKLTVAVTHKYSLNELQLSTILSSLYEQIKEIEFFTILQEGEDEEIARNYLLNLQSKYSSYNTSILLLKGVDKYDELKKHVEQSEDTFLVLQEGSRSFSDELFRKYMTNELIHTGNIPLIVLSV